MNLKKTNRKWFHCNNQQRQTAIKCVSHAYFVVQYNLLLTSEKPTQNIKNNATETHKCMKQTATKSKTFTIQPLLWQQQLASSCNQLG